MACIRKFNNYLLSKHSLNSLISLLFIGLTIWNCALLLENYFKRGTIFKKNEIDTIYTVNKTLIPNLILCSYPTSPDLEPDFTKANFKFGEETSLGDFQTILKVHKLTYVNCMMNDE